MSDPLETITGQRELGFTVKGAKVYARAIALSKMDELYRAQNSEADLVALYTGLPREDVDALTFDQVEAALKAGDELNTDFFVRWLQRKAARLERIGISLADLVAAAAANAKASPPGSSKPPSLAA